MPKSKRITNEKKNEKAIDGREVVAHIFGQAIRSYIKSQDEDDIGYFFYTMTALSVSGFRDEGYCPHEVIDVLEEIVSTAYPEDLAEETATAGDIVH
jgi:hypothetical protein